LEHFFLSTATSGLQFLPNPFPEPVPIRLYLKRDDQLDPLVSGNKWRKLKYNLLEAQRTHQHTLLTYGGAYSNHIYATAAVGRQLGFKTVGVIRGEENAQRSTPTLAFAREQGMALYFVSREQYRKKEDPHLLEQLRQRFGLFYTIPEGGSNALAVRGMTEVLPEITEQLGRSPDFVCCPVGTGGTLAGLVLSAPVQTRVLGFSALKGGHFLAEEVKKLMADFGDGTPPDSYPVEIITDYHFGGYARTTPALIAFIKEVEQRTGVQLEQVYTGKMLFGIYDLARRGLFPDGASVVALHTGGLQGRSMD